MWPWRRNANGDAKQAIANAEKQHEAAKNVAPKVERVTKAAKEATRRADRFAEEIERSWHLKRGAT